MPEAAAAVVAAEAKVRETAKTSAGQRRVNILWEATQAAIAICVTMAFIFVSIRIIDSPDLKNAFFLIVGFYFGRTNHQRTGGVKEPPANLIMEGR